MGLQRTGSFEAVNQRTKDVAVVIYPEKDAPEPTYTRLETLGGGRGLICDEIYGANHEFAAASYALSFLGTPQTDAFEGVRGIMKGLQPGSQRSAPAHEGAVLSGTE